MKKIIIKLTVIFAIIMFFLSSTFVLASNEKILTFNQNQQQNEINETSTKQSETVNKLVEMKDTEKTTLEDYQKSYGSESYGLTAYILNKVQIFSIPFCFIGITISAIYQYILGIRKLDTRDKGFAIMISIITIFVIAQILPLIFAIVVKGWRG